MLAMVSLVAPIFTTRVSNFDEPLVPCCGACRISVYISPPCSYNP